MKQQGRVAHREPALCMLRPCVNCIHADVFFHFLLLHCDMEFNNKQRHKKLLEIQHV